MLQTKILLPSTINIPPLSERYQKSAVRTNSKHKISGEYQARETHNYKVSINAPENDWIQCLNPEGTQDAQVIEKQTSTGQTRNIINRVR
jgi:hypothetical protein